MFSGAEADYTITTNVDGSVTVDHTGGTGVDGRDRLRNIERLQFTDVTREITSTVLATVPNVVNQTRTVAATTLANADLTAGAFTLANSSTIAAGRIISQTPIAGATVPELTAVALVVSLGPANVTVPGVMGMTQAEATTALATEALGVGTITTEASATIGVGHVIRTNPAAGASVSPGTAVALVMSSGFPTVQVPGLVGLTDPDAVTALDTAGLTVGAVTEENSDTVDVGVVISQTPPPESIVAPGTAVSFVVSIGPSTVQVPGVVGLPEDTAKNAVTSAGLIVGTVTTQTSATVPAGDVISQSPAAATAAAPGSAVTLVVSSGSPNVAVPNVVGLTEAAAQTALTSATLTVGAITTANHATVPAGSIISQNPAAGASAAVGSAVALVRSLGPAPVTVPNVVGLTEAAAGTAITNATLTVGTITTANDATVPAGSIISQNPAAGASAAVGSAVALVRSLGPATTGDAIAPVAVAPAQNIDLSSLASSTVAVRITWSATDNPGGSGIARYEVQRSNNGGTTWAAEATSALATAKTLSLTPGTSATTNYRLRVRAVDVAGNVGAYATGPAFRIALTQQNTAAVIYTGTWTTSTDTTASGGSQAFATTAGATATYTFTGSNIGWAAVRASDRGRAEVRIDGALISTVDLYQAGTPSTRRVAFQRAMTPGVPHTIEVRVLGTKTTASTGTRVDLDAFVVAQ